MKQIVFRNEAEWRVWLEKNHDKERGVCVISYKKHTGRSSMSAQGAMDEAICFGWIDTIVKRLDDERYMRCFMKRGSNAKWSDNTLRYARRLIKEGKMTPSGLKAYKAGLKKPTHDHGIPKNPGMIKDLRIALSKDPKAKAYFAAMAPSSKKTYLRWILKAVRPETRQKRIQLVVKTCRAGKNIF
jgi:uncharacterized protein YdeI (YjbR/CyaY-like superfamily)